MKRSLIILVLVSFFFISCQKERGAAELAKRIQALEADEQGGTVPDDLKDLEKKIRELDKPVTEVLKNDLDLGYYYKILGLKYIDYSMYQKAFEAFQKAIEIYPRDRILFYRAGICAGQMAKFAIKESDQAEYNNMAERSYLRALELMPDYKKVLYALSVLYVFEMNKPDSAEPLLDRLLALEKTHTGALFLKARILAEKGYLEEAINLYERIEDSGDSGSRQKAFDNRQQLLNELAHG